MSTDLYWRPVRPQEYETLPRALKYVISRRLWGHDGSLVGNSVALSSDDVEYLNGIKDATSDDDIKHGIDILLEAIEKYTAVEVWLK